MKYINQNELARNIARIEGKEVNLTIAQVKEVLRVTFDYLAYHHTPSQIMDLLEKHGL